VGDGMAFSTLRRWWGIALLLRFGVHFPHGAVLVFFYDLSILIIFRLLLIIGLLLSTPVTGTAL